MSEVIDVTDEMRADWEKWKEGRPTIVRQLADRFNPWTLYLLKTTRQRVIVAAINEDGTLRVDITGEYNLIDFDRSVFGINPDDLEECDIPSGPCGTLMSPQDVEENIDALRVMYRPDLFVMGDDGIARRKDN